MKISKVEGTEIVKPSPKRKMEGDVEKLERTPEKDKIASSTTPAKKIKLNRETGKKKNQVNPTTKLLIYNLFCLQSMLSNGGTDLVQATN